MEGKANLIILYCIVAVLALALAVLSGYLFIGDNSTEAAAAQGEDQKAVKLPKDDELETVSVFKEAKAFNLKAGENDKNAHVALLNMKLQYFTKVDGLKDTKKKVEYNLPAINEIVILYFQRMTYEDAINPNMKDKFKAELKEQINRHLLSNEQNVKGEIVYNIIFDEWFCQ